ncbi:MAG: hypothetical protein DCC55_11745 [Chloroflexi bacterium]|nr:MAG: hypothetical protein DCC55_11745 [Chloroflexota bacterium]
MALTGKRYTAVDRQLQDVRESLMALAIEIQEATPPADPFRCPCHAAMKAADAVENLRYMLAIAEAKRQIREKQAKPELVSEQGTNVVGWETVPAFKWLTGLLG